ncbi:alpha/beta fold hydrolase [Paracraurococcus lichenis]|uniref:Alpha/beta hydrolase n=1 Tax=Paracraurococcus lichenis TaxID=3064888 RepID=A0ABT9DW38_9PROT|nr:alpha/beta hydrolase [Paracraurococcus sp. LOR1-02]MDO9708116.1 alpha/beta hydrolase [Paracraurococcus sp. LOR1-02]
MTPGEILLAEGRLETGWWGPGPEAAPTIVLLHEGLGSLGLWRDFPARLQAATGCGVFAFSRFGYGGSDPVPLPRPLDYMQREAREVLPQVLDTIGLRRGLLLGHSDGGSIAAIHAGSVQDFRVQGLVLLAPHFFTETAGLAAIAEARRRYEEGDLRARLARHHRDVDVAFRGWNGAWLDPGFPAAFDLLPDIAHIRVPVLAIQGEADPYGTAAQLQVLEREAYCPVEVLLLPGIGHTPQAEAPEAVLAAVREFSDRLFRPAE